MVLQVLGLTYLFVIAAFSLLVVLPVTAFGWSAHVVLTGSMRPAIAPGNIVLAEPADPGDPIDPGRVITFGRTERDGTVTHRVVEIETDGDGTVAGYRTQGDANPDAESGVTSPEAVLGVGLFQVPYLGWPVVWITHQRWTALGVWLVTSLALLWPAAQLLTASRRRDPSRDGAPSHEEPAADTSRSTASSTVTTPR